MNEQFSKLTINTERKPGDAGEVSQGPPSAATVRTPSSQYNKINADLHARMKAFQEQRSLKRTGSIGSNKNETNNVSGESKNVQPAPPQNLQQIVNKPLPPLPPSPPAVATGNAVKDVKPEPIMRSSIVQRRESKLQQQQQQQLENGDVNISTNGNANGSVTSNGFNGSDNRKMMNSADMSQFNPNRRAPRRPMIPRPTNPLPNTGPKQSLSARRGMKLPLGGMSLKMPGKPSSSSSSSSHQHQEFASTPSNKNHLSVSSNNSNGRSSQPGSLINGIQSTSTSSSNEEQRDTEGTTPKNGSNSGSGGGGLFANFSKYVDIKSGSLNFAGKLSLFSEGINFSNGYTSRISLDELEFQEELGHGNYGNVSKVLHKPTSIIMAMKEVRLELDEAKFRQILMELEILHKCKSPYIVDFYGAFFIEGAVYMCMEYMDGGSLDKVYDFSDEIGGIDEPQLARITLGVIEGLKELKDSHNIIHRDVKPTNILCSARHGTVKLCDFGVSGNLVASLARTNIGCQSYMAPERIRSLNPDRVTYSVQSDIWSLGLSILEMALGRYPYPPETFDNIFSQLSAIVDGPPPKLPKNKFSVEAQDFVSVCLQKIPERRPTYAALLEHRWLLKYKDVDVGLSSYITDKLNKRRQLLAERGEKELPKYLPALHMGGL